MIELLFTMAIIGACCIPAGLIAAAVEKYQQRKTRAVRRAARHAQAQQEQEQISALYNHLILQEIKEGK